jgi:hypothetical protein
MFAHHHLQRVYVIVVTARRFGRTENPEDHPRTGQYTPVSRSPAMPPSHIGHQSSGSTPYRPDRPAHYPLPQPPVHPVVGADLVSALFYVYHPSSMFSPRGEIRPARCVQEGSRGNGSSVATCLTGPGRRITPIGPNIPGNRTFGANGHRKPHE